MMTHAPGALSWKSLGMALAASASLLLPGLSHAASSFSTSQGWKRFNSIYYYQSALGDAGACTAAYYQTGRSNVDLRGTAFGISPNQWVVSGYKAAGTTTYSSDSQVVNLTGGGYCGGNIPHTDNLRLFWMP